MKKKLLALLFLVPLATFSQDSDSEKFRKLSVGLIISPDYSCITATSVKYSNQVKALNALLLPKFRYTAGLSILLHPNNNIAFETGAQYSDKGYRQININNLPGNAKSEKFIDSYRYLDVPFILNCYFHKHRLKYFVALGASVNIFLASSNTYTTVYFDGHTQTESASTTASSGASHFNYAAIAGFGLTYDLKKRLTLRIEPTYTRSINTIFDGQQDANYYLYAAGLNIGLYYKF